MPLRTGMRRLLTVLAVVPSAWAQVPPDAGQVLRDLQPPPAFTRPPAALPKQAESEAAPAPGQDEAKVLVRAISIVGNSAIPSAELQPLVAGLVGAEQTLGQLHAGARRITAYYRERGYLVARAYLPAQDITEGAVTIHILEGQIAAYRIRNQSRLSDKRARAYLGAVNAGEVIHSAQLDRGLLLLQDTPGVGAARAALQPGASAGTSDLLVELDPAQAYAARLEADNYGTRATGKYRLGAALAWNSPLGWGDLLSLRAVSSGPHLSYARLAYQVPVGAQGLKLGVAHADTRYELGAEFAALQAHGRARSSSVYASYPFLRSQSAQVSGTLSLEHKQLVDQTDASISRADKQVRLLALGAAGYRQDGLWGGGVTSFDVSLSSGKLTLDAASLALDAAPGSAGSHGAFSKLAYSINRLQRVGETHSLMLALSGQRASKNLGSSEKFSLGGVNGVRALAQGEASGDQGWLVNLELQRSLMPQLQGQLFYDAGSVDSNRNPFVAGDNTRFIAGAGLGLLGQLGPVQFKTTVAWPTSGGDARAHRASRGARWWLQLSLPL